MGGVGADTNFDAVPLLFSSSFNYRLFPWHQLGTICCAVCSVVHGEIGVRSAGYLNLGISRWTIRVNQVTNVKVNVY